MKLEKAINDWVNKEGDIFDNNNELIKDPIVVFANKIGIPPQTFSKYIHKKNPRSLSDGFHSKKRLMD
jgi:hypothetical protein